jgi:hypothetical protein
MYHIFYQWANSWTFGLPGLKLAGTAAVAGSYGAASAASCLVIYIFLMGK